MSAYDVFGLRPGTNVSKAASLAARPSGATMGELIDATGDTQYNIFRRLEAKGYSIRREGAGRGMRIWLKDKDEKFVTREYRPADGELNESAPKKSHEGERLTFSLERDLQRALRGSLEQLEPGLVAIDNGREDGYRDITAKDAAGNMVIVELKANKAGPEAVTQLLAYMGELKAATNPSGLRGILVAPSFQTRALAAASIVPKIALKRYIFHLTFTNA